MDRKKKVYYRIEKVCETTVKTDIENIEGELAMLNEAIEAKIRGLCALEEEIKSLKARVIEVEQIIKAV